MKYLFFLSLLWANISTACVVDRRENIPPSIEDGFRIDVEPSGSCDGCRMLSITAPLSYKGELLSHFVMTLYSGGQLLSKVGSKPNASDTVAKFSAVIGNQDVLSYRVDVEYGEGRCPRYQFTYAGENSMTDVPGWLKQRVRNVSQGSELPVNITEYTYDDKIVYLFEPRICCDIGSKLYSEDGDLLCESIGLSGTWEKKCSTFTETAIFQRTVLKPDQSESSTER